MKASLPENWKLLTVDQIKAQSNAAIAIGPFGSRMKADVYVNYGIPVIRGTNISDTKVFAGEFVYISKEKAKELKSSNVYNGDLVFPHRGSIGEVGIITGNKDVHYVLSSSLMKLTPNPDLADSLFLFYYFRSEIGRHELLKNASQVGTPGIATPLTSLKSLEVIIPPLPQQYAIAGILGALDDKIELNRRINVTLESMARAVFRQWFIDGDNVQNWDVGKLGDVAENIRRGVNAKEIEPETHYVGLEHMPRGSIALTDWEDGATLESNKFIFKEGEFLFGKLRPYFHKVGIAPFDGVCSTDILVIVPKSPEWYGFVLGHISSVELINHTSAASTGTKMPRTNWSDIARYEIPIPPVKIAEGFNTVFLPIAQQIRANIMQSRTLASLRDSLLPKLIKGDVQVKLNEEADDG